MPPVKLFLHCLVPVFYYPGKRKRDDNQDALVAYLERMDERAEAREERMMEHQERTAASLLGLVERMVSAMEGVSSPDQGHK